MRGARIGILVLMAWLGFVSCARDDFVGTYGDELGMTRYEFHNNGRVHISVLGTTVLAEYRLDSDKVLVSGPQGALVLTRRTDELHGPMGLVLTRLDQ